jgi:hypothetical protein
MTGITAGWFCSGLRKADGPLFMESTGGPLTKRLYDGGPSVACVELRPAERLVRCGSTTR